MIISQKVKYLSAVILLVWLVFLIKYLSRGPMQLQERHSLLLEKLKKGGDDFDRPLNEVLHPYNSLKTVAVKPEHVTTKAINPINPAKDNDLAEVSYHENLVEVDEQPQSESRSFFKGPENEKQKEIVEAFLHAWSAYKKYAWGADELKPLSKSGNYWMNVGLTIVDSLDTLYIMGLEDEFNMAKEWVSTKLNVAEKTSVQFFEIVIRLLGGLLSAFHLSGQATFLEVANNFGKVLKGCFDGPSKVPCHRIYLDSGKGSFEATNLAEVGTVQLEFRDLGRSTGISEYEVKAAAVSEYLHGLKKYDGLLNSLFISALPVQGSPISFGGQSDSYYEYLLKQWIQTGKSLEWLKKDYEAAIEGAKKHLIGKSVSENLLFIGSITPTFEGNKQEIFQKNMEHLACFLPGTLALGYMNGLPDSHLELARELMKSCYAMYSQMPLHLSPEMVDFSWSKTPNRDFYVDPGSAYNIHRPETVESLFYMYRATGDATYKDWGWKIFKAFENHTRLHEGYAGIQNVDVVEGTSSSSLSYIDKMETFYLAETLKYLYLLFSDRADLLPLDRWVFNTEAHPLPIYDH